jgi:hypothetical protein
MDEEDLGIAVTDLHAGGEGKHLGSNIVVTAKASFRILYPLQVRL